MTSVLADARRGHRGLYAFAVAMAALTPVTGRPGRGRRPGAARRAALVQAAEVRDLVRAVRRHARLDAGAAARARPCSAPAGSIVAASAVEMAIIVGQAAARRAQPLQRRHRRSTPRCTAIMGATIVVLWLATARRRAALPARSPAATAVAGSAIRLGPGRRRWSGWPEGFLMVGTTARHAVGRARRRPRPAPGRLEHHRRRPADRATSSGCTPCRACRCSPPALARGRDRLDEATRVRLVRIAAAGLDRPRGAADLAGPARAAAARPGRGDPGRAGHAASRSPAAATVGTLAAARRTAVPTTV